MSLLITVLPAATRIPSSAFSDDVHTVESNLPNGFEMKNKGSVKNEDPGNNGKSIDLSNGRSQVCLFENVALFKPASQSTTWVEYGGVASNAVNGKTIGKRKNTGSTVTCTANNDNNPWWQVDLEGTYDIGKINIFNRHAAQYRKKLKDFTVDVMSRGKVVWSSGVQTEVPNPKAVIFIPGGAVGDLVKISKSTRHLILAEVQVMGVLHEEQNMTPGRIDALSTITSRDGDDTDDTVNSSTAEEKLKNEFNTNIVDSSEDGIEINVDMNMNSSTTEEKNKIEPNADVADSSEDGIEMSDVIDSNTTEGKNKIGPNADIVDPSEDTVEADDAFNSSTTEVKDEIEPNADIVHSSEDGIETDDAMTGHGIGEKITSEPNVGSTATSNKNGINGDTYENKKENEYIRVHKSWWRDARKFENFSCSIIIVCFLGYFIFNLAEPLGYETISVKNSFASIKDSFASVKDSFASAKDSFASAKNSFASVKNSFASVKNLIDLPTGDDKSIFETGIMAEMEATAEAKATSRAEMHKLTEAHTITEADATIEKNIRIERNDIAKSSTDADIGKET